ncbi:hypothetical protein PK28_16980 (plasmid) [Hymenobacter sp. DG25B]|uniref:hypothetical protein n=1 Tax=Hymenobacter sp. DG25B TaxID=1385664 RepID=UPI000540BAA0|nr:hypothetical protein [Hymenobacter sp. DG25B]AIZ65368.1 hypothetical protein PK28_16980 [Hymenobacter sp. DG25B]
MQTQNLPATTASLNLYITWCVGQDFAGEALIYASSSEEAFALLDRQVAFAQPKHKLFPGPLRYRLLHYRPDCVSSRNTNGDSYGEHIYLIGQATDEGRPRIIMLDDGEDVRFND